MTSALRSSGRQGHTTEVEPCVAGLNIPDLSIVLIILPNAHATVLASRSIACFHVARA
jgi:hypothetical protein